MVGRHNKVGLDYFELDCHMDAKVRLIQAEYGLKGFAVFVRLLQEIYGENGYYCEWTQDRELLFASENGLSSGSVQLVRDIVSACIRRDIFSERLYKEYGILSSSGVQKKYLKATAKREVVELKKEYLLISIPKNRKNVVVNSISSVGNTISSVGNTQSRVEKSREEDKKHIVPSKDATTYPYKEIIDYLNAKAGTNFKHSSADTQKHIRARCDNGFTLDDFKTVIDKKVSEWKGTDMAKYIRPSTLFGTKFEGYLNQLSGSGKKKNQFSISEQHDYDFDAIEKDLLGN